MSEKIKQQKDLKERTKKCAIRVVRLVGYINKNGKTEAKILANSQLLRSGTAIAANYRAACRAKSRKDFISKIGTVVEEADETQFWLEVLRDSNLIKTNLVEDLLKESGELTAIMTSSKLSAIKNQSKK